MTVASAVTRCSDDERMARAALSAAVEPPGERVALHLSKHGPETTLAVLRAGGGKRLDPGDRIRRRLAGVEGEAVLASGDASSARFICPGDAEWSDALDELPMGIGLPDRWAPPLGLWVRGKPDLASVMARSAGVVGARAATDYGNRTATELGADLSLRGWTVVSGAAYGIDGSAHRGAMAVGRPTVAILACGVDVAYPPGHSALLARLLADGLIVSELPPGTRPSRPRFLARNRLIAAMTRGSVVVEAALRSGALSTAQWAVDIGRQVVAVPGPVTSALSAGCHKLVRGGVAVLVTDAAEVIDAIGDLSSDAVEDKRGRQRPLDSLAAPVRDVFEALPARKVVTIDRLCRDTGLAVPACMAALGELAAKGLVHRSEGGWQVGPDDAPMVFGA